MNKTELIENIATQADTSRAVAQRVVDEFFHQVTDALKKGIDVAFVGFGSFSVRDRAARAGRNPQTGEVIQIKAAKMPVFKAGKALKDAVQGNDKDKGKD